MQQISVYYMMFFSTKAFTRRALSLFLGASISGDLLCANGTFEARENNAIIATRANIVGTVAFAQKFRVSGGVRLEWSKIGGNLTCYEGAIEGHPEQGIAVSADGITVAGSVFFKNGFTTNGEVRFVAADIKGDFECSGSR